MSNELMQQIQRAYSPAAGAPATDVPVSDTPVSDTLTDEQLLDQIGAKPMVPEVETTDPTLFDRMGASASRHLSSIADSTHSFFGQDLADAELVRNEKLEGMERIQAENTAGDWAAQVSGDIAGIIWDWGADAVVEAGTEGWQYLPTDVQEMGKEALGELINSEIGQAGFRAIKNGDAAWQAFSNKYPKDAKTLAKTFNLFPGGKVFKRSWAGYRDLQPLRIEVVGKRSVLRAPKGRDKDVYNLIAPELTAQQQTKQVLEGRVSDPEGLNRKQSIIPSMSEWEVVDEVAKTKVSPAKTKVENANIIIRQVDKLNDAASRVVNNIRGGVDGDTLARALNKEVDIQRQNLPAVFGADGTVGAQTLDNLQEQLRVIVRKHGDSSGGGSYHDLLTARQELDFFMLEQFKAGTFGDAARASVATEFHTAARNVLNGFVIDAVPEASDLLKRQNNLLTALDNVAPKAGKEAKTALGRIVQAIGIVAPAHPLSIAAMTTSPLILAMGAGAVAIAPFVYGYGRIVKPALYAGPVRSAKGAIDYTIRDIVQEGKKLLKNKDLDSESRKTLAKDVRVLQTLLQKTRDVAKKTLDVAKDARTIHTVANIPEEAQYESD